MRPRGHGSAMRGGESRWINSSRRLSCVGASGRAATPDGSRRERCRSAAKTRYELQVRAIVVSSARQKACKMGRPPRHASRDRPPLCHLRITAETAAGSWTPSSSGLECRGIVVAAGEHKVAAGPPRLWARGTDRRSSPALWQRSAIRRLETPESFKSHSSAITRDAGLCIGHRVGVC